MVELVRPAAVVVILCSKKRNLVSLEIALALVALVSQTLRLEGNKKKKKQAQVISQTGEEQCVGDTPNSTH